MSEVVDRTFETIAVQDTASFVHTVTHDEVAAFITLSGDSNPLHSDASYAATTVYKKPIVHGMFLGALCSRLVGMYLPGKRSVYLSQECVFKHPVYVGDTVTVTGTVVHVSMSTRIVELNIVMSTAAAVVFSGNARVRVLE